ncbi:site-2 protease family protein [Streptomyces daliensis]|uniref:CBS domain-containing protein n=1 Tax=Streptomyces daliensis TaxID=299421 RepID=A0A8T4ITC4_9ACTN|nr:CBS domain-containing protein [Streptomyces daliensis]
MADTDNGGKPRTSGPGSTSDEGDGRDRAPGGPDVSEAPARTGTGGPDGSAEAPRAAVRAEAPEDAPAPARVPADGPEAEPEPDHAPSHEAPPEAPPEDRPTSQERPAQDPEETAPEPFAAREEKPAPADPAGRGLSKQTPEKARTPDKQEKGERSRTGGGILMGRPFGVPVYVAPSWFLVAALITWVFGGQLDRVLPHLGALRYLIALFFAVAFYASVLVHELAHTVAALRFKLPVRRIQLQFFGGVSEIEKESETPGREFVLAFVGPLLSLVLAGVFYVGMKVVEPGTVPGVLLAGLMVSNLIVAAFNLLPGLPLDGGRMLRALVWKLSGRAMTGTVFAAWTGRALAIAVLIGLPLATHAGGFTEDGLSGVDSLTDALLAAILAAIIWTGAGNSLRMARLREHLPELRARALTRRAVPVHADTPLSEALRRANEAGARALVVVDGRGGPISLVREAAIVGVPEHRRPWVAVSTLAQDLKEGMRVRAELAGEELLDHLRATPATEYLVVEDTGEIYGVLSTGDVEKAFVAAMAKPSA